jgi:hypothetical protein
MEKENFIEGLNRGATVSGELLCDLHLPKDHPWRF